MSHKWIDHLPPERTPALDAAAEAGARAVEDWPALTAHQLQRIDVVFNGPAEAERRAS